MKDTSPAVKICFAWLILVAIAVCDSGFEALLFLPGAMFIAHTLYYRKVSIAVASPSFIRPLMAAAIIKLEGNNIIYHKDDSLAEDALADISVEMDLTAQKD